MAKRHFLQQAHKHIVDKHPETNVYVSEKYDGMRAFWDGGITRGIKAKDVPWANTAKDKKVIVATGLWSRYGNVIHAPEWFLDLLPNFPLDGELWIGRQCFQKAMSICRKHKPVDSEWAQVKFMVFDSPRLADIFYDSYVDQGTYQKEYRGIKDWVNNPAQWEHMSRLSYRAVYTNLIIANIENAFVKLVEQQHLDILSPQDQAMRIYYSLIKQGAEGIVLRKPDALYLPERQHSITKMKPFNDAEATVVGYITGRATSKGSKLLGLMGALVVSFNGHQFKLSGFTDSERILIDTNEDSYSLALIEADHWASLHPETLCPSNIIAENFPIGSQVTFIYRELSKDGLPKEARYYRKREGIDV
jgi:ATP-dependent DNA ligase